MVLELLKKMSEYKFYFDYISEFIKKDVYVQEGGFIKTMLDGLG